MKSLSCVATFASILSLALLAPGSAADLDAGRRLAQQCAECHGADGISKIPEAPHLAGQNRLYLFKQLIDFRMSEFPGGRHRTVMNYRAPRLGATGTDDLAAWYASRSCPLPEISDKPKTAPAAVRKTCATCHGEDGRTASGTLPRLAGQRPDYLLAQLRQFAAAQAAGGATPEGTREHPLMNEYASRYTDKDFQEIARWYAAQSCR